MTRSKKSARSAPTQRQLRVGELIRHKLAEMLSRGEIHDDVIASHVITVPEVRLSPDLKLATAYVVTLGGDDTALVIEALNRNKKYIRAQVAQAVNLKFAPDIRFRATRPSRRRAASISCWRAPRSARTSTKNSESSAMSRRKKGNPVHGWVVLDKPLGMTSTQAVGAVRRLFEAQKAGHAGTLDPLATGILPIALGEATKTVPFAVDGEKAYRFTVRFGIETDTDDAEGQVVRTSERLPSAEDIDRRSADFTGEISQVPPAFSAIKVDGERAYDLARSGEERGARAALDRRRGSAARRHAGRRNGGARGRMRQGHLRARPRARHGTRARQRRACHRSAPHARRRLRRGRCRSICRRCGRRRKPATIGMHLRPVEAALDDIPGLSVGPGDAANLARGQAVLVRGRDAPVLNGAAYAHFKGRILALGELEKGAFRPTRVFNFG